MTASQRLMIVTASFALFSTLATGYAPAPAPTYLGLYLQGQKVGYSSYGSFPDKLNGVAVTRSDSTTKLSTGLLGTALQIRIDSSTWTTTGGALLKMRFLMASGGRTQQTIATFLKTKAVLEIDNSGQKSRRELALPKGPIVDDPLTLVLAGGAKIRTFYILDPTTASFIKNEIRLIGPTDVTVKGKTVKSTLAEIYDPRASTKVYVSAKGDFIKAEGPMGIEMIPESKAEATGVSKYAPSVDLAFATSIKTDVPLEEPASLTYLKLRLSGPSLDRVPSDGFQTVVKDGASWEIAIHPPLFNREAKIFEARAQKPDWVKPSLHVPSDSAAFKNLAQKIIAGESRIQPAARAVQKWVFAEMRPNAGIGVLRDAREVLASKEGVCRDYAILTATILRAGGIPTRLASGLVNWDGTFYYHAWVEVWDGLNWIGVDSTTDRALISAAHVKLADGNVEEAFTFTFLDKVKVEVLEARK